MYGRFTPIQLTAGADLNTGEGTGAQYKAIAVGGTIAATGTTAIGLLQNKPKSGEDATIGYAGHLKGVAGAAISSGARLAGTKTGYFITFAGANGPRGPA